MGTQLSLILFYTSDSLFTQFWNNMVQNKQIKTVLEEHTSPKKSSVNKEEDPITLDSIFDSL